MWVCRKHFFINFDIYLPVIYFSVYLVIIIIVFLISVLVVCHHNNLPTKRFPVVAAGGSPVRELDEPNINNLVYRFQGSPCCLDCHALNKGA